VIKINRNEKLTLKEVNAVLHGKNIEVDQESLEYANRVHQFLVDFSKDKVIYGINTGLGPMAQYKVADGKQVELQYNLIRSHSAGCGASLSDDFVKAAMLSRLKSVSQGVSGIHTSALELLTKLINHNVFFNISEYGGVGASGDLVQLSHLALTLIGEGYVSYEGKKQKTADVFEQLGFDPITVVLREGLSLINGTSVMTGIGLVNLIRTKRLFGWMLTAGALINEVVESFDDHFSNELNQVKHHAGQQFVAGQMQDILKDSELIGHRANYFYNGNVEEKIFRKKVQEYYSLRCLPQILGPIYDTIEGAEEVIVGELNSVSDNPVIDMEKQTVFHGGNFHGDYVSLEMDKLKLAVTRLSMLAERHINYLFNARLNEILPPFVNLGVLGLNLGMQGMQFTATSTAAENQTLSNSMYVHSIPTNNDNQDIVSMGTNSALMTARVIENANQVLAIELIALAQAVDHLKIEDKLAGQTKAMYQQIRSVVPVFTEDDARYEDIEKVVAYIREKECLTF